MNALGRWQRAAAALPATHLGNCRHVSAHAFPRGRTQNGAPPAAAAAPQQRVPGGHKRDDKEVCGHNVGPASQPLSMVQRAQRGACGTCRSSKNAKSRTLRGAVHASRCKCEGKAFAKSTQRQAGHAVWQAGAPASAIPFTHLPTWQPGLPRARWDARRVPVAGTTSRPAGGQGGSWLVLLMGPAGKRSSQLSGRHSCPPETPPQHLQAAAKLHIGRQAR